MTPLSDSEVATVRRFENAEPAPESWRPRGGDELRCTCGGTWPCTGPAWMGDHSPTRITSADGVVTLPAAEVAALRAKAAAADRVRELTDRWLRLGNAPMAIAVRRALDGTNQTDRGRC